MHLNKVLHIRFEAKFQAAKYVPTIDKRIQKPLSISLRKKKCFALSYLFNKC